MSRPFDYDIEPRPIPCPPEPPPPAPMSEKETNQLTLSTLAAATKMIAETQRYILLTQRTQQQTIHIIIAGWVAVLIMIAILWGVR